MNTIIDKINEYTRSKGPPINLVQLATEIGLSVKYESMPDDISGHLEKQSDGSFCITVNVFHHPNRQRFTIAHEIGHFVLHNHLIGNGVYDNKAFRANTEENYHPSINQKHETEANKFAAAILMPTDRIKQAYDSLENKQDEVALANLAHQWGVSVQALMIRLKSIK